MKIFFPFAIIILVCVIAPRGDAQCDSTPPLMSPAFTLYGANADDNFGQNMYVIHDTAGHPHLVISIGASGYYLRDYSRYAGQSDTSYRCCLQYTEAHECHVTGSKYVDYVVHKHQAGFEDSIFLIPGSPQGIWSQTRQLLMTPAVHAQIATGDFTGSGRDAIVIGNMDEGVSGTLSFWQGNDSLSTIPDTIINADIKDDATAGLGITVGATDLNNDSVPDLIVMSGGSVGNGHVENHEMNVFFGGKNFLHDRLRWRDQHERGGWWYENVEQFNFASVTKNGLHALLIPTNILRDTVWGVVDSGLMSFCYLDQRIFDTTATLRWRTLNNPAIDCVPNLVGFGYTIADVGDIDGDGESDIIATASTSGFGGSEVAVLYLGGSKFDTLPDAYYVADIGSTGGNIVSGFDFNSDSLFDFALPMPHDDAGDHPAGHIDFFAGSRRFRSIGVRGTKVLQSSYPTENYLRIFPQPVHDKAELVLDFTQLGEATVRLEIDDMLGRLVMPPRNLMLNNNRLALNLAELPSGIYQAIVHEGTHVFSQSFVHIQ